MTDRRDQRMKDVLAARQLDLTVILEDVWDHHNISAVLRSCDAVGIQEVFIISPKGKKISDFGKKSSASASKWLTIHHFSDTRECLHEVRNRYSRIFSTRLDNASTSVYNLDLTQSTALVFGNEHTGVSNIASTLSDGNFIIPQAGMIQSLNISVACAVSLYECFRQRNESGFYRNKILTPALFKLYEDWKKK
ncbi:MAG: RNA methyltransferase [Chitinophagales bacterium]|nr:RNA methyltransferase [Chitinophagales bacterium]